MLNLPVFIVIKQPYCLITYAIIKLYTVSDIQTELEMLDAFLSINGSTSLLEEVEQNQETDAIYSFNPSKILIFLAEYLRRKNYNEIRSLAIFMKIIEVIYQIDKHDPESFILI